MKALRVFRNISILLIIVGVFAMMLYFNKIFNKKEETLKVVEVDNIVDFGYVLDKDKSEFYKDCFKELKGILNNKELNYEQYAVVISKMFVVDLFTLSDKVSRGDIGGVNFVYEDFRIDFIEIAKESLYNSVKSNIYGNRVQDLPTVKEVNEISVEKKKFKYKNQNYENAYYVKLGIVYEKEMGYPKECNVVLIKKENILQVVKMS